MRVAALVIALAAVASRADASTTPGWDDVPALIANATQAIDKDLRACAPNRKPPWGIALIVSRDPKTGASTAQMPFPPVGIRGLTDEETCLLKTVPKLSLPDLPAGIDRIIVGHTVPADGTTTPAVTDKNWDAWRNPAALIASIVDDNQQAALAKCDKKARTVRVIMDLSHRKTRVWLPAWQFHSPKGDGSTPAPEAKVKACVNKVIAKWKPPVLPNQMGELQLAIPVSP